MPKHWSRFESLVGRFLRSSLLTQWQSLGLHLSIGIPSKSSRGPMVSTRACQRYAPGSNPSGVGFIARCIKAVGSPNLSCIAKKTIQMCMGIEKANTSQIRNAYILLWYNDSAWNLQTLRSRLCFKTSSGILGKVFN